MKALKKKHNILIKLINLDKSNLEKTRRDFVQLKLLLEKAKLKESKTRRTVLDVEMKIRKMILEFNDGTIDAITQYRLFIDNKNIELKKQCNETLKIQELFDKVSKEMRSKLLKLRKLEEKDNDTVSSLKLEMGKDEIKQSDDMWLQRMKRS